MKRLIVLLVSSVALAFAFTACEPVDDEFMEDPMMQEDPMMEEDPMMQEDPMMDDY